MEAEKVRYRKISNNRGKFYDALDKAPAWSMPPEAPKLYKILGMNDLAAKYGAKFGCSVGRRFKKSATVPTLYESSYHTGMSFRPSSPEVLKAAERHLATSKLFHYKGLRWRWTPISINTHKNGRMTVLSTVVPARGVSHPRRQSATRRKTTVRKTPTKRRTVSTRRTRRTTLK